MDQLFSLGHVSGVTKIPRTRAAGHTPWARPSFPLTLFHQIQPMAYYGSMIPNSF
jgi:hypothetical protein